MGLKKLNWKVEFTKEQISKWRNTFKQERTAVLEKNYKAIYVIVNEKELNVPGVTAPILNNAALAGDRHILDDTILYYRPLHG